MIIAVRLSVCPVLVSGSTAYGLFTLEVSVSLSVTPSSISSQTESSKSTASMLAQGKSAGLITRRYVPPVLLVSYNII